MLATDAAAILQVRPDGYTFRPVIADGKSMKAFRATLELHAWESELGSESTLVRAFPKPDGWKWVDPAEPVKPVKKAAAPRKRTPRAAPGAVPASATMASMSPQRIAGSEIDDSALPF